MNRPLIALTMDQSPATAARPFSPGVQIYYLNSPYVRYVEKADCIPLIVPTINDLSRVSGLMARIDGLLLTGGDDVFAESYGEQVIPGNWQIDSERTFLEKAMILEARRQNKPVYAICRGCQMLNVALGGTLYQDIPMQVPQALQHRSLEKPKWNYHPVTIEQKSLLGSILSVQKLDVTTSHHQCIKELAPGLRVTARAPDGIIEAIEDPQAKFFLGVQWHAEAMDDDSSSVALLTAFIEHCRQG